MKLDARLRAVAKFVTQDVTSNNITHIDIGSDHGHLLKHLLKQGKISKAIAVEKNELPLKRTQVALRGYDAETYLGDGFEPLDIEAGDSASICGLGAKSILAILEASPQKLPKRLIIQSNKHSEKIRRWAYENDYHLIDECMVDGFWNYAILLFQEKEGVDTVYGSEAFSLQTQFKYGPYLLKKKDSLLLQTIQSEYEHFKNMDVSNKVVMAQIGDLKQLLEYFL